MPQSIHRRTERISVPAGNTDYIDFADFALIGFFIATKAQSTLRLGFVLSTDYADFRGVIFLPLGHYGH
jgi:hypothetical protein